MEKPTVVSLFSGAGGMDLGFMQAGFDIVWANDFQKDAVMTYQANIGDHIVLGDIRSIKSSDIPDNPDIIIGGFPCQGFSIANKHRSMEDERNFLYRELWRIIRDKQPKFFLAENVKGLISMANGEIIEMIKTDFESIGYSVEWKILTTSEYGVPQNRERVFIMGNRIGVENEFPFPTHSFTSGVLMPPIKVKEAIEWLSDAPLKDVSFEWKGKIVHNHIAATNVHDKFFARKFDLHQPDICEYLQVWRKEKGISVKQIDEIFGYRHTAGHWFRKDKSGSIPKVHDWWRLKELLGFDNTYDEVVTTFVEKEITFEQNLRITNWDTPSDTITASGPEIHINKERRLSVREAAILQTFPLNHIFHGSKSSQYRQVGNAVPVLMAYHLAKTIHSSLSTTKE